MNKINVKLYHDEAWICYDLIRTEIRELEKAFPKLYVVKDYNYRYYFIQKYYKVLLSIACVLKKALKNRGYKVVDID